MQHIHLAAVLALMLAGFAASADVYKWTDRDGNVHYGDRPPASGEQADSVSLTPSPELDADYGERSLKRRRLLEAFEADRAERQRLDDEAALAKRDRAQQCEQARRMLADLERANLLYTTDQDGNRVYMSDDERHQAARDITAWVQAHCD